MEDKTLTIHASKLQFRLYLIVGLFPGIYAGWLGYHVILEKSLKQDFLSFFAVAVFFILLAIFRFGTVIIYRQGILIRKNFFVHQRVNLSKLIRAKKYHSLAIGATPPWGFRLEDDEGGVVNILISDYDYAERNMLATLLHPYIFVTRVEKNFMDLPFYVERTDLPKSSVWHVLKGSLLYVMLPAMALTLALVAWAIFTQQPAFR